MRQRWSKWRPRGHYLQFMAMSTEKTNGENWGSDPWHSWGALSGKPSCVNMHDLRVSATVILYVLCMHVHAHIMKHWNVCKQRHMQTRTCKQASQVFFHLWWLHMWLHVTSCDYHVSCRNFAVGLPSQKKAPIKKVPKRNSPFRNQQHNMCVCVTSRQPQENSKRKL